MEKFHFSTFQGDTSNCSRAQPASTSHLAGEGWVCPRFQSGIGVSQQKKRSFYSIKSSQQCLSPRGCARAGPGDASDPLRGGGTGLGEQSCFDSSSQPSRDLHKTQSQRKQQGLLELVGVTRLIIFRGLAQLQVSVMEAGYSWNIRKV